MLADHHVVIRRKGAHFLNHVTTKLPAGPQPTDPTHRPALLSAWLLDQNVYELHNLVSEDVEPTILNTKQADLLGMTLDDARTHLRAMPGFRCPPRSRRVSTRAS